MANQDQLAILRRGVTVWNEWRERNTRIQVDLSDANLSMLDLIGANLSWADLLGAKLIGTNLTGAKLLGADLSRADLREALLGRADLSGADLQEANLKSAILIGANLSKADCSSAHFSEADLRGINLREADLRGANLSEARLAGADLREAKLRKANLSRSDLKESKLTGADLRGTDFTEAKLMGADLSSTQALATNFSKARLTRACLENWNINSATCFNEVICDYVYLRNYEQARYPRTGSFMAGEFAVLFQQTLNSLEIILTAPIDWIALAKAIVDLRSHQDTVPFILQKIESSQDQTVVLTLGTVASDDTANLRRTLLHQYELAQQTHQPDGWPKYLEDREAPLSLNGQNSPWRMPNQPDPLNALLALLHQATQQRTSSTKVIMRQMHQLRLHRIKIWYGSK